MRALVFGETGQVARELQRRAPDSVYLGRNRADLGEPESLAAHVMETPDIGAVINAAAWTAVDAAEDQEDAARVVNARAPGALARACAARRLPLVHISTDYVFSGDGAEPFSPADPPAPRNAYGRTKLAGEEAVRAAGGVHAVLRTSWVFSAHGANFVKTMLRLSETRDRLTVVDDQIGGPTPAGAIAAACLEIARQLSEDPGKSGTYHFSGAPEVSWAGFARAIFETAGRDVTVEGIPTSAWPTPAARPLNSRLDCSATEAAFGIARPDWRASLAGIVAELAP